MTRTGKKAGMRPRAAAWHTREAVGPEAPPDEVTEGTVHPRGRPVEDGLLPREHSIRVNDMGPPPDVVPGAPILLQPKIGHLAQGAASLIADGLKALKAKVAGGEPLNEQEWNRLCKLSDAIVKLSKEERETDRSVVEEMARMAEGAVEDEVMDLVEEKVKQRLRDAGWKAPGDT